MWRIAVLALFGALVFAPAAAHAQAAPPDVRRTFVAHQAEFRDDHNRAWIVLNLDPASGEFGSFGLFVYPSAFELAVGYFGVSSPRALGPGSFALDGEVPVMIRRPTNEIVPAGQNVPTVTDSGSLHLQGTVDLERHSASLRAIVDGRDVLLEAREPDLTGAPECASASLAAYLSEDWATLYSLYTDALRVQVSQADFEAEMRERTPPGPPVQVLSSTIEDASLGTTTGFLMYHEEVLTELQQPSGRVTPVRFSIDVVREMDGQWRLARINTQRFNPQPPTGAPAA